MIIKKFDSYGEVVSKIEGIGHAFGKKLARAGIYKLEDLRAMDVPAVHAKTGISVKRLNMWRSMSALQMVDGIDRQIAEVFVKAGIVNLSKLISASPDFLLRVIENARTPRWIINIIPDTYRRIIILADVISWQNAAKRMVDGGGLARRALIFKPRTISRQDWGAVPPSGNYTPHNPVQITIHHTAGSQSQTVKDIQKIHMDPIEKKGRNWIDIGYHYVIDARANIYEGRPPTVIGAHVEGENPGNVGVSVIGNYDITDISETQHNKIVELCAWVCNFFGIAAKEICGHRDLDKSNICPGRFLYARLGRIKTEVDKILNPPQIPPSEPPPPSPKSNCFITAAAYGSTIAPEVQFFRSLRDNIIRKTRWGNRFFDDYWKQYYKFSPKIAEKMRRNPALKSVITWSLITPLLNYLKLVMTRPSINLDKVGQGETKIFLTNMKRDMDEWLNNIEAPESFEGLSNKNIVDELGVILSFVLREKEKQRKYLNKLVARRILPLKCSCPERDELLLRLKGYKISPVNIGKIVCPPRRKKK